MTEQAERMVLEYLSRVGEAAYGHLPSRRRTAYLAELRSRIDNACASAKADRPDQVGRILRDFGDPVALVARECAVDIGTEPVDAAVPAGNDREDGHRPPRDPPPWRGGPDPGWFGSRSRPREPGDGASPAEVVRALITAGRRHPPEALSIAVYLVSGIVGAATFIWLVGAVLVGLSRVWERGDKWIAVGGPIAATAVGMLVSQGDESYIDQIIMASFLDTGVIGLRGAALGCALYLAARTVRIVRSVES